MLNSSNNPPQQQHHLQPLRQLLHDHPVAFCSGLWAALVIGGSVATLGLLNPGPIEQGMSKPTPGLTTFQESTQQKQQNLPLPLIVSVILGCGGGSLILTQVLKYSSTRRPPIKKLRSNTTVRKKRQHPSNGNRTVSNTPQPASSALTVKSPNHQLAQVTVLPPEESHPLDRGDENLAEMMDLRKRHSLASLMRGK
jgi:hypothetical protein